MDNLIVSLISGAGTATPILALMWYLLKDLKTSYGTLNDEVSKLQLDIAQSNYDLKIQYQEKNFERTIRGLETRLDNLNQQNIILTQKVDAAWKQLDRFKKGEEYV